MLFSKTYYVSYERFDGEIPQSKALTRDIVWIMDAEHCDGAGMGHGSVPRRLTCPRPVPHLHIAAANPAG